jgi:F420-dependent oxidoreductase-like protein
MRIGILIGTADGQAVPMADLVVQTRQAEADGFASGWFANIFGMDALTAAAVCGQATSRLELGTAVVPTYPRHPYAMAQQALSTQAAAGGRLVLGIGPSHQPVVEAMWGLSFQKPVAVLREYLEVLLPLLEQGQVAFQGETYRVAAELKVPGATPCPVLLGGLGPRMLALAGTICAGTVTAWVGPRTLAEHVVPSIREAAAAAGRSAPRIAAMVSLGITADVAGTRERVARGSRMYGALPSYRAMLDREGVAGPADVVVLGDEAAVAAQIRHYGDIGVTDLIAVPVPGLPDRAESLARTRALLVQLAHEAPTAA